MSSIRDRVISSELKVDAVEVPQWGGKIGIREMTVKQRVAFANEWARRPAVALVDVLIDCTFDPDTGKALFEKADRDVLTEKGGTPIQSVTDQIFTLSGMSAAATKELEKNSPASAE